LDNKMWVKKREPSVTEHLVGKVSCRSLTGWHVHNLAVDGALVQAVHQQLSGLPQLSTHCIVSVGGNNGLAYLGEIENGSRVAFLPRFAKVLWKIMNGEFRVNYEAMIEAVCATGTRVVVCGMYEPCFYGRFGSLSGGTLRRLVVRLGVMALNHVVRGVAQRHRLPLIDLHAVFNDEFDFANPIEPSAQGGDKLSENILHVLQVHTFGEHCVYASRTHGQPPYPYAATVRDEDKSHALPVWRAEHEAALDALNRTAENDCYRNVDGGGHS